MKPYAIAAVALLAFVAPADAQYLGNFSANRALPPAPPQPPNTFDNRFGTDGNSPRLYDSQGGYHGNVNNNPYDPDSVANPYGRFGSRYSPDSVTNPFGQFGSPFAPQSPTNPYGTGMPVYGTNP